MRKLIVFGLVALFVVASQIPAQAAGRTRSGRVTGNRQGVFGKLMEMERKKNEWLFGR